MNRCNNSSNGKLVGRLIKWNDKDCKLSSDDQCSSTDDDHNGNNKDDESVDKHSAYKKRISKESKPYEAKTAAIVSPIKTKKGNNQEKRKYSTQKQSSGVEPTTNSHTSHKTKRKITKNIDILCHKPNITQSIDTLSSNETIDRTNNGESGMSDDSETSQQCSQELLSTKYCAKIKKEPGATKPVKHKKTKDGTTSVPLTEEKLRIFQYPFGRRMTNVSQNQIYTSEIRDKVFVSRKAVKLENIYDCRDSNMLLAEKIKRFVLDVDKEKARMMDEHPRLTYGDEEFLQAVMDMREQIMVVDMRVDIMGVEALRDHFRPAQVKNVAGWLHNFMQNKNRKYKLISKSNNLKEGKYIITTAWWVV